ncbi:MAG: hypothetical protein EYC70_06915 [Planctomycetota bacterium]|nr:MAG: hypothetical protein EYC70_06915 [Planctomycetota bacterium]
MPNGSGELRSRRFLDVGAAGGRCSVLVGGSLVVELGPSWTPRRIEFEGPEPPQTKKVVSDPHFPFAGFLPWVKHAPQGLWQGTRVRETGPAAFLRPPWVRWRGGFLEVFAEWDGPAQTELRVDGRKVENGRVEWAEPLLWPRAMQRVAVELVVDGKVSDRDVVTLAQRRLEARGTQLRLNGEPLGVRGLLHWGYFPDLVGPDPEPERLRTELRGMQERGFNLLKCCLFVPPRRFLDVCDEEGMLVWMEYPVWAQPLRDPRMLPVFEKMFQHDAGHPCVVIRTFTCENDHVEPALARKLYERVKELDPGALAADNSGWVGTAHVGDFWDEHAYLHNAQWPYYLERMQRVFAGLPEKPFLLGETMVVDADTESSATAMAIRRYQAESLLHAFPDAGYVICGARDALQTPLGVQFRNGRWKDAPEEWNWQRTLAARAAAGELPDPALRQNPAAGVLPGHREMPADVEVCERLDLENLRAGARVLHVASPRPGSWKVLESTFWSPVPVLDVDGAPGRVLRERLFFDLFRGFGLAAPPPGCVRVLAGVRDFHDRSGQPREFGLVYAARVGRGRLLVSALDPAFEATRWVHAALCQEFLLSDAELPELELEEPVRSWFVNGPWTVTGASVPGGRAVVVTGTPADNRGASVFQGWAEFRATVTVPADWRGPALLRAHSIGDGWELYVDEVLQCAHGNRGGTWDSGRDVPLTAELAGVVPGRAQQWLVRVKDHRGGGGMVGPLYLTEGDPEAGLLF